MPINIEKYGHGPAIVFFHGWGFDSSVWHPFVAELSLTNSLYLVDLPGFGGTANMEWFAFNNQLLELLPSSFALVGWSIGGLYAMKLALSAQNRVSHLINVATSPYFNQTSSWPGIATAVLTKFAQNLITNPAKTLQEFMALQKITATEKLHFRTTKMGLQQGLSDLQNWDLRDSLADLKMKVVFFFGNLDSIVPYRAYKAIQQRYPQFSYFLYRPAAHLLFLNQPSQFCTHLKNFIQDNNG